MFYEKPLRFDELYHYGVIGMRWGVRKKTGHTRKEIRADNKKAFELGKKATVLDAASRYAMEAHNKSLRRLDKAMAKDPNSKKVEELKKENELHAKTRKKLDLDRDNAVLNMSKHRAKLVSKYGEEHVSKFKHEKAGDSVINERVTSKGEHAMDAAMVLLAPLPVRVFYASTNPRSRKNRGIWEYVERYQKNASKGKRAKSRSTTNNSAAFVRKMAEQDSRRTASLGLTNGTNPFIFG